MELAFLGNVFSLSIILASNAVAVFSGRLGEDGERKAGGNVRPKADTWLFFGFPETAQAGHRTLIMIRCCSLADRGRSEWPMLWIVEFRL
jgi:hypothetical protein